MKNNLTMMDVIEAEMKLSIEIAPDKIEKGLQDGFLFLCGAKVQLQISKLAPKNQIWIMKLNWPDEFEYGIILGSGPIDLEKDIKNR